MEILVVGCGYVGLVTGACLAEMGHSVICLDINREKIEKLKAGIIPIFEPGLSELVQRNVACGRLRFTMDYAQAVSSSSVCFLAVPTPSADDGSCDTSFIMDAAVKIANEMKSDKLIVIKSTVPVGTGFRVKSVLNEILKEKKISFEIVSNPEFLKEGSAISDCMKPDRIILGVESQHAEKIMREIYGSFTLNHDRIIVMDILSAEMTKYAANAMLATRISFMNELAGLCEKVGANINAARVGIGSDNRIGYQFLYAGVGFGGSCFPKDLRALIATAKSVGHTTSLLSAVEQINEQQKELLGKKILSYFSKQGGIQGKTVAIWGLSFKPNTDDVREAPALVLIQQLKKAGAKLKLFDPVAISTTKSALKNQNGLHFCQSEYEAADGADAIALVTEWKQFRSVDFDTVLKQMEGRAFFDGRNQYKNEEMQQKGFDYFAIGIPEKK